jgi:hypothetical protein
MSGEWGRSPLTAVKSPLALAEPEGTASAGPLKRESGLFIPGENITDRLRCRQQIWQRSKIGHLERGREKVRGRPNLSQSAALK